MDINFTELELKLIKQALKIWRGDFPDSKCEPSIIWQEELKALITKISLVMGE